MAECAFKKCINHGQRRIKIEDEIPEVTYHLFPKDPVLQEKWLKQMNQEQWVPDSKSALCSLHFHNDYFITDARGFTFLKKDAIPTEFELYQDFEAMSGTSQVTCCAYKCANSFSPDSSITFHPFPLEMPDKCAQWLAAMNCSEIDGEQAVLCSEHFEDSCFVYSEGQKYLTADAVPSIFLYPDANEINHESNSQDGSVAESEEMMDEQPPDMTVVKYEMSDENLELIRRHDEVINELMTETERLLDLTSKRLKLERRRTELEHLLRASISNTSIDKEQIRGIKPLLKDLQEQQQSILVNCMAPCVAANIPFESEQG